VEMLREASFIDEWLEEKLEEGLQKGSEQGLAQGLQLGLQQGLQQGIEQGKKQEALLILQRILLWHFEALPTPLLAQLQSLTVQQLDMLIVTALQAQSLDEFAVTLQKIKN
jgi:flagellar biosynthesis/type III secretory pathway protein FliH